MYTLEQNSAGEYYIKENEGGIWTYSFKQVFEFGGINYWLVINPNGQECPVRYDGARDACEWESYDWHYKAWYGISKPERQKMFAAGQSTYKVCTDPGCRGCDYPQTLACTPNVASNSLSVREAYPALYRVLSQQYEEGNNPMLKQNNTYSAPTAIAAIETKTDLQTQREYLLGRHRQVEQSIDYGALSDKLAEAFNINHDPQPKSTKELLDGIASGKFKLDEKKSALQEIAVAKGSSYYDEDDHYVPDYNPLWAMDFGGPTPDRVGFETAKKQLRADLKAAKDTIMIGEPADGLKALQALEAWTPPAGPAN